MALRGDLKDMSLSSLISINCNEMNQARLVIRNQGQEGALLFEDGNIAHLVLDSQEGEELIYELLTWEEGEFELEQGVPPPKPTVTTGVVADAGRGRWKEECVGPPIACRG